MYLYKKRKIYFFSLIVFVNKSKFYLSILMSIQKFIYLIGVNLDEWVAPTPGLPWVTLL